MDNYRIIEEMLGSVQHVRAQLERFQANQDDASDEGNEDHIDSAFASLDDLESDINDLVP